MIRAPIACLRFAALAVVTAAFVAGQALWGLPYALVGRRSLDKRMIFFAPWARLACRILGVRVVRIGSAPKPPFLLVSNHVSWLDIAVLASRAPGVFVAMSEIASWPVFSSLCRIAGVLFVDRRRLRDQERILGEIAAQLDDGLGVILFPEAGLSDGTRVRAFRSPLLEAAAGRGVPVHYASVTYRTFPPDPPAGRVLGWPDGLSAPGYAMQVARTRGIEATIRFGEAPLEGPDRKELARRLHEAVSAEFAPLAR